MEQLTSFKPNDYMVQAARAEAMAEAKRAEAMKTIENYDKIEQAAQEFEAVFLSEMLKPMFEQIKTDPMFGGGQGEDVFSGMLVQEYANIMSQAGGIGLAEHVKDELIRIQEQGKNVPTAQMKADHVQAQLLDDANAILAAGDLR
jgi:Rod binding domain-containing protein